MKQEGISGPEVFEERRTQEKIYLESLAKEPQVETDQMDYYQRLVNLKARQSVILFYAICDEF